MAALRFLCGREMSENGQVRMCSRTVRGEGMACWQHVADADIVEIPKWSGMEDYPKHLETEVRWCMNQVLAAYDKEPNNSTGEQQRAEMMWLASFVVVLLPAGPLRESVRRDLAQKLLERKPHPVRTINCEHLFAVAGHHILSPLQFNLIVKTQEKRTNFIHAQM